jgi:pimeloyl-ACP methyl ester carboxylesterase
MAELTNLYLKYTFQRGATDLPVLLAIHGWSGSAGSFDADSTLDRLARYGFFVASLGLRGNDGASGSKDASGKECYDVYDALTYIRANFLGVVSQTKAALFGSSGGAGVALGCACKFPDAWNCIAAYFPMSDYGRDGTDGWYFNNPGSFTGEIATRVGGTPVAVPGNYYARDAVAAIANYTGAPLYLFHDSGDTTVPPVHSARIAAAMTAAGLTNCTRSLTGPEDDPRWIHGYPADNPGLIESEAIWKSAALTGAAWTVPASGTLTCIGYLKTKRFEVRLGGLVDHAATVVYGAVADQYTVTPLTGSVAVTITQADGKTVTQTISEATVLTVA